MTTIYNYSRSGIYLGEEPARDDPLTPGEVLVPAFATKIAPMAEEDVPEGMVRVFDAAAETWSLASASLFQPPAAIPETPTLDQLKEAAQASMDSYFATLYNLAVPNPAIANEYTSAYTTAKAWVDAGSVDPAPARVQAMAESQGVTNGEAAALVIQKWQEAEDVLDLRGAARLRAKTAIRAATDQAEVFAAEAAGRAAMESVGYTI